jgi:hypothetical protein
MRREQEDYEKEGILMQVTVVGLDISKQVFQLHGVSAEGKVVLRKRLRRSQVAAFMAHLPAWSASKPGQARITGRGSCNSMGMKSN